MKTLEKKIADIIMEYKENNNNNTEEILNALLINHSAYMRLNFKPELLEQQLNLFKTLTNDTRIINLG